MKIFLTVLTFIGIFTAVSFGQSKSNANISKQIKETGAEKTIVLEHNESSNATKLMFFGEDFGHSQYEKTGIKSLTFGMMFFYPGKNLDAAPAAVTWTFWVESKKPKFAQSHNVSIFTPTETIDLGSARYAAKSGENREFLNFAVPFETLKKIAESANGNLKIGDYELKFTPEHLRRLKDFVALASL